MTLKKLASLIAIATAMTAASAPNALAGQPIKLSPDALATASAATTDPGGTEIGPVTLTAEVDSTERRVPRRNGRLAITLRLT